MSSAGAGIGYGLVTAEEEYSLLENQLLLGALLLWALSFLAGLWALGRLGALMILSKQAIDFRGELPNNRQAHEFFSQVVDETAAPVGSSFALANLSQIFLLISGAAVYVFVRIDVFTTLAGLFP